MKFKLTRENIVYITYTLLMMNRMLSKVNFLSAFITPFKYIAGVFLLLSFIFMANKIKKKELFFKLFVLAIFFITSYVTGDDTLLFLYLLILPMEDLDFEKFIKYDLKLKIILIIFVVSCYYLGLTSINYVYRDGILRSSMGFPHPNTFGIYMFGVCADIIYLNFNKMKFKHYALILISIALVYQLAGSRTSTIMILIMLILYWINKISKKGLLNNKIIKKVTMLFPLLMILVSFIAIQLYNENNSFIIQLNTTLSKRISYSAEFYNKYGVSLFGTNVTYVSNYVANQSSSIKASVLDNSYLVLFINYGVASMCAIIIMLYKIVKKAYSNNDLALIIIIVSIFIFSVFEKALFDYAFNCFIFYYAMNVKEKNISGTKAEQFHLTRGVKN